MGRGDNRKTWKMRRKKRQTKLKARIKRRIDTAKAAKKPARGLGCRRRSRVSKQRTWCRCRAPGGK